MTAGESKVTTEGVRFEKQTRRKTVRKTVRQFHPVAARQREDRGLASLASRARRPQICRVYSRVWGWYSDRQSSLQRQNSALLPKRQP